MKTLIRQICAALEAGEHLVLATVASQSGSTPRLAGARMMIHSDGRTAGTIGGGQVEAEVVRKALQCLQGGRTLYRILNSAGGVVASSGMICGGGMEVVLEYIGPESSNQTLFRQLLQAMESGRRSTLVSPLAEDAVPGRFLVDHRGQPSHDAAPEELTAAIARMPSSTGASTLVEHKGMPYLISSFAIGGNLILIGAGHIAVCTAEAASRVGFRVLVMDDRAEFAHRERYPMADEIRVLPSFSKCFDGLGIDRDSCLVIATRSHTHDMEVLDQALHTEAGYIGMIGSRKKRDAIYARLLEQGVDPAALERVHCPIGTPIEADTPEEIAVSITGELILHRARSRRA